MKNIPQVFLGADDGLRERVLHILDGPARALHVDHVLCESAALDLVRVLHHAAVGNLDPWRPVLEHGAELFHLRRADGVLHAELHQEHSLVARGAVASFTAATVCSERRPTGARAETRPADRGWFFGVFAGWRRGDPVSGKRQTGARREKKIVSGPRETSAGGGDARSRALSENGEARKTTRARALADAGALRALRARGPGRERGEVG